MQTTRRDCYVPLKKLKGKNKAIEILARRKERIVQTLLRRQNHRTG